ncbi:hypothetical protein Hanom_Chr09g00765381 [Helianthus anomalus]
MDSGKADETKENLTTETSEKSNKTENGERVECFEFKISTGEMQEFVEVEAQKLEENSMEMEACAFMAGIEVKSTFVDKRCT